MPKPQLKRAAAGKPDAKLWYSEDGRPIQVDLPDGRCALVTAKPRTLEVAFHKRAREKGCLETGRAAPEKPVEVPIEHDPEKRIRAITGALLEAVQAEEDDPAFESAFLQVDGEARPNMNWIKQRVGFPAELYEVDPVWKTIQDQLAREEEEGSEQARLSNEELENRNAEIAAHALKQAGVRTAA